MKVILEWAWVLNHRSQWFLRPIEASLHKFLFWVVWVFERSTVFTSFHLDLLWARKAIIQHQLVVFDHIHFPYELRVKVVLTSWKSVGLLYKSWSVARTSFSETIISLIINSQVVVKRTFAVCWAVLNSQSTREVRNISITSTTVVDVDDRFWMNRWNTLRWPLFLNHKGT